MSSNIGGDDPDHDLSPDEKDLLERELRALARKALFEGDVRERRKLLDRATEISRQKSAKSHQDTD